MKKIILTVVFVSAMFTMSAQTETEKVESKEEGFDKWSIELAGGGNKAASPMYPGYNSATPSFYSVDLGARYMFNNKFGLKLDLGYNNLIEESDKSLPFTSKYSTVNLQGVFNFGRIMNFETWTKTVGLLVHSGFGYATLAGDFAEETDEIGNFIVGSTVQVRLTNSVALTGDVTVMHNFGQDLTFDGNNATLTDDSSYTGSRGFTGKLYTATVGITVYLGKNEKHADWYYVDSKKEMNELEQRIAELETANNDSDKDGVVDHLDTEPNSIAGVMVDTKGRSVDVNNNAVPDELESYIAEQFANQATATAAATAANPVDPIKILINDGYLSVYFDFNKSIPTEDSTIAINSVVTYLRNNPSVSIDITGHSDEIGAANYNDKLAASRAEAVKKALINANIADSRLNIVTGGVDSSVDKNSADARKLARRVTFTVK